MHEVKWDGTQNPIKINKKNDHLCSLNIPAFLSSQITYKMKSSLSSNLLIQ